MEYREDDAKLVLEEWGYDAIIEVFADFYDGQMDRWWYIHTTPRNTWLHYDHEDGWHMELEISERILIKREE